MAVILLALFIASCTEETASSGTTVGDQPLVLDLPAGFPEMPIPENNQLTTKRVELGKLLFFDTRLSIDSSISCGSCHLQGRAFTDGVPFSNGVNGRKAIRNSPTLANIGYHPYVFRDGGVTTLERQVIAPIEDEREMGLSFVVAVERMKQIPEYQILAKEAYDRDFDAFVLTRAISAFERTLISGNSPYDQYTNGNTSALNDSEKRGMDLFMSSRLNCSGCHSGFNFTNYEFQNNGIYEQYSDSGRTRVSLLPADRGKFKVATLRNVEMTAPYMHDGSFATLEAVIEHYNSGGKGHVNQDARIQPLNLTPQEKEDLLNFLKTLTDTEFLNNPDYTMP